MRRNITADLSQRFIQFVRVGPGLPTILDTPRILPSTLLSLLKAVVLAITCYICPPRNGVPGPGRFR